MKYNMKLCSFSIIYKLNIMLYILYINYSFITNYYYIFKPLFV